ncbi:MAG: Rrf2 family transcriptional regulator [Oligoflexia bacterium]|nr:Rrf2 family transcriptional regulator [Oligoflexia bacterium]
MVLSRSVEYAMRIMAFLALYSSGESVRPMRAKDIAPQIDIPSFYISKILRRMVEAGLLKGSRGHGGGFTLARPAKRIRFIDIFEAIEGPIATRRCVFGLSLCSNSAPCVLHHRWSELNDAFQQWARKTSLADVQADVAANGRIPLPNLSKD